MKDKTLSSVFIFTLFVVKSLGGAISDRGPKKHKEEYKTFPDRVTYWRARSSCEMKGGVLAQPKNDDETIGLRSRDLPLNDEEHYWIGLRRDAYGWKWRDGTRLGSWDNFRFREPIRRGDCVVLEIFRDGGGTYFFQWIATSCNERKAYICEFKKPGEAEDSDINYAFLILGVVAGVIVLCVCCCCGVGAFIMVRRKRQGQKGNAWQGQAPHTTSGPQPPAFAYTPPTTGHSQPAPAAIQPGPVAIKPAPGPPAIQPAP